MKTEKSYIEKIPAYFTQHWPDGKPTGAWWLGDKRPKHEYVGEGFLCVFHPEQDAEITMIPSVLERKLGFVSKIQEVDLNLFIKRGSKLSWRQRIWGVA